MKTGGLTLRRITAKEHGVKYRTNLVSGTLNGVRIRKKFRSRDDALGELNRLQVAAANMGGELRPLNTRLSESQLAEAETGFSLLDGQSLLLAIQWFKDTYRPPMTAMDMNLAVEAFLAEKKNHVRPIVLRDYERTLRTFIKAHPQRTVHSITTEEVRTFLTARNVGKKRWNNLRGDLHAFYEFCKAAPQQWTQGNPVTPVTKFKILRGVPEILSAKAAADFMKYVEGYKNGMLVPYFAICLFAGLRPSVPEGEVWKIGQEKDPAKFVDEAMNVIRISPEISKVKSIRQVKIRPNLAAWLKRYPLKSFPLIPTNAKTTITKIRTKFDLGSDVMRHTFLSMHVAAFKSLGEAALEGGTSEAMARRHYVNIVSEAEAAAFWSIVPTAV